MQTPPKTPFAHALSAALQPDDTLLSLLMRTRAQEQCPTGVPLLDLLHGGAGLRAGDVVELCGDAGAGKSALLLHAVARLLAATEPLRSGSLGGALRAGARVAFFSLDGRLCVHALARTVAGALAREEESEAGYGRAAAAAASPVATSAQFASATTSPARQGGGGGGGAQHPVRPLRARLRAALARVDVHLSPPSPAALGEALEALAAPGAPPLALLALDGMGAAWHWGCKLYGGSRALDDAQARLAGALQRLAARTRCRVLWARPALFGRVDPALRAPAGSSAGSAASGFAAAAALAECAAEEALGSGSDERRPTLQGSTPALTLPSLVSEASLEGAAGDSLGAALGGLVTHRVVLTRLRAGAGAGVGVGAGAGADIEAHPELAAAAQACASASAGVAVAVEVGSGGGAQGAHPRDGKWLEALGGPGSASASASASGRAEVTVHTVLVAARMATSEGVKECILALCA